MVLWRRPSLVLTSGVGPGRLPGRPGGPVEDQVIAAEAGVVVEAHLAECRRDGPAAAGQDRPEDEGDGPGPGARVEFGPEGFEDGEARGRRGHGLAGGSWW